MRRHTFSQRNEKESDKYYDLLMIDEPPGSGQCCIAVRRLGEGRHELQQMVRSL